MAEYYGRVQQEPFSRTWIARCWAPADFPIEGFGPFPSKHVVSTEARDRHNAVVNLQQKLTDFYGPGNTVVFPDNIDRPRYTLAAPKDSLCLNCGNDVSFQYAEQVWVHRDGYQRRCPDVTRAEVITNSGEVAVCTIDWDNHTFVWSLFPKGTRLSSLEDK